MYFLIKLDSKNPQVFEYTEHVLKEDLKYFGTCDPMKLSDYDFKVFKSEKSANSYLCRFQNALDILRTGSTCKSKDYPCLIYKRHYLAQSYLGEKPQTYRAYKKPWKPGQYFNLYDQTLFLTVKLDSLRKTKLGYRYCFSLI